MLQQPTLDKLSQMKLHAMANAWRQQQQEPDVMAMSFEERFGMLVDAEALHRENRRLSRLLRAAKLRISNACVEDIQTEARRGLDKNLIRKLATCGFVQQRHNIFVTGATGVGKTYIACALTQNACRKGYKALYTRMPRLLDELTLARADGTYPRFLARLARIDVLVFDDWGVAKLKETHRHDILEILEDRYDQRSTIIASQLPLEHWHDYIGDPTIADAVLDRTVHNAYKIELEGPSKRKEKALKTKN